MLTAPADEAWVVVYNDVDAPRMVVQNTHGTFGDVPPREAAVLRMQVGRQEISAHKSLRETARLGAHLRGGCVYFARILDARGKLEIIPERRMDATEWMQDKHVAPPRKDVPFDLSGSTGSMPIDEAPEWFQNEAVCERVSSPP